MLTHHGATATQSPWFIPAATLVAALVGLIAAGLAALVTSNATAIVAERHRVEERYAEVLRQIGRLQASRIAMTVEGYPGLDAELVRSARQSSIEDFFRAYRHETFELRALLSGLPQTGVLGRVVAQQEAQVAESDIEPLRRQLNEDRTRALQELKRWWLP